jgi:hypothetical protein
VLIVGGLGTNGAVASAELYNPSTGTFTVTGSLHTVRWAHTASLLSDGMVLIAGGQNSSGILSSAELYNPSTGAFAFTGSLSHGRTYHTAASLTNGEVLIAGGANQQLLVPQAELYNPSTGAFAVIGSLCTPREYHTATLLNTGIPGFVLIDGGYVQASCGTIGQELYDPNTSSFITLYQNASFLQFETATVLNSGDVLLAGGFACPKSVCKAFSLAVLFNPSNSNFSTTASLNAARYGHTATRLNTGKVLVVGGYNTAPIASAELYNP